MSKSFRVLQDYDSLDSDAVIANAVFTAPLVTLVLDVSVTIEDKLWRKSHCSLHKCLSQYLLRCNIVLHIEEGVQSDIKKYTHFTGSDEKVPR